MNKIEKMTIEELLKLKCTLCSGWGEDAIEVQKEYACDITIPEQEIISQFAKLEATNKGHQHHIDGLGHSLKAKEQEIAELENSTKDFENDMSDFYTAPSGSKEKADE